MHTFLKIESVFFIYNLAEKTRDFNHVDESAILFILPLSKVTYVSD